MSHSLHTTESTTDVTTDENTSGQPSRESKMNTRNEQLHAYLDQECSLQGLQNVGTDHSCELEELRSLNQWVQTKFASISAPHEPNAYTAFQQLEARLPSRSSLHEQTSHIPSLFSGWFKWMHWSLATVAVALCIIWFIPQNQEHPSLLLTPQKTHVEPRTQPTKRPLFTAKGFPIRMLHAHRHFGSPTLAFTPAQHTRSGAQLYPGDLVQFSYHLEEPLHLMIVSLNNRGEVFPFVPFRGTESIYVKSGKGTLPRNISLKLDQYIGPERFFIIASKDHFRYKEVQETLLTQWKRQDKDLIHWPEHTSKWSIVQSILIYKRPKYSSPFKVEPSPKRTVSPNNPLRMQPTPR